MVRGRSTFRPNGKFYIFIGAVVAIVIFIVWLVNNISTATVELGEIRFETAVPVVIVRDEQIVSAENYGKPNYLVQEGSRVEADNGVAEVYMFGYTEKVMNNLMDTQTSIMKYQENIQEEKGDTQLAAINESIAQKSREIKETINSGVGDVLDAEQELKQLMESKRSYLKEAVATDSALEEFYSEEEQLLERVEGWRDVQTAPQTGVVSFYIDGTEQDMNADNITDLTPDDIQEILSGSTVEQSPEQESVDQPLFRLVNNYKWYLLVDSPGEVREFANENEFDISFVDYPSRQYGGMVVGQVKVGERVLYVIEINDDIGELLSTRRTDAKIFTKFEGFKVPERALQEKEGTVGVMVVADRQRVFVPVDVKIIKDGSAIIVPKAEGSILAANQQVEL